MPSFDIVVEVDQQEVDNAVNQAQKEIAQRYDFRGSKSRIEWDKKSDLEGFLALHEIEITHNYLRIPSIAVEIEEPHLLDNLAEQGYIVEPVELLKIYFQ